MKQNNKTHSNSKSNYLQYALDGEHRCEDHVHIAQHSFIFQVLIMKLGCKFQSEFQKTHKYKSNKSHEAWFFKNQHY